MYKQYFSLCDSVIKPVVKNKSQPDCTEETHSLTKEKLPVERVKTSTTKSKTHSKDKLSTSLPSVSITPIKEEKIEKSISEPKEPKPTKSKKSSIVASNSVVDIDIPLATTANVSSPTGNPNNSAISGNKQKVKTSKKPKKLVSAHPAFYFVSI